MTEHDFGFELDPAQFQERKETVMKSVLQTLRNSNTSAEEKNRQLQQVVTELKQQRQRIEYVQEQIKLSIISGAANDTHH